MQKKTAKNLVKSKKSIIFAPKFNLDLFITMAKECFWTHIPRWQRAIIIVLCGVFVGLCGECAYLLRMHTYLGDDPAACVNCHLMTPYYATWDHSSHAQRATCNDCHVPHENVVRKFAFKGVDGMKHVGMLVAGVARDVPEAQEMSKKVILENCVRCHLDVTTTLASVGQKNMMQIAQGEGKACWDCHRDVPHGGKNSLSATANARVPVPQAPVPEWVKRMQN